MVHWDDFRFILALHRYGTMTAAAAALKTNVATVSRRIERAGEMLGKPLFHREGGSWAVSNAGRAFIAVAEEFEANLRREENNIDNAASYLVTTIKLAAPPVIISALLLPALDPLLVAEPLLNVVLTNRVQASGLGDADIFLQTGDRPHAGRLIMHKIGSVSFGAYRFAGTTSADWVALLPGFDRTLLTKLGHRVFGRPPRVRVEHFDHKLAVMKTCALGGILPDIATVAEPELELIAEHRQSNLSLDLWYAYHASRRDDAILQKVVTWLNETMGAKNHHGLELASEGSISTL